jgi:transposase
VKIEDSKRAATMAMRREGELQGDLLMTWAEMPRSPGHVFYDRLQELLSEAGFDVFVEETCKRR